MLLLAAIPTNINKTKFWFLCIAFGIFALFIVKPVMLVILEYLDNYYISIYMRMKIEKLILMLEGDGNLNDATSRVYLMNVSINTFLKNPILGKGIYYHNFAIVGGHSQILDDLARFGLIGYGIIIMPIVNFFKFLIKNLDEEKKIYIILIGLYIGLSIFNVSMPYYISMVIFTIIPIWINGIKRSEDV